MRVRVVVSFRSRLHETIRCTASTVQVPPSHTTCITSFSRSVSGGRTRAEVVRNVMVQYVPLRDKFVNGPDRWLYSNPVGRLLGNRPSLLLAKNRHFTHDGVVSVIA